MNILSLFDGIGSGYLAANRANLLVDSYYGYEIDRNAIEISTKNFPSIIHCGDISFTSFKQFLNKDIDLIIGGFPCTDLSVIGKKKGLSGEKSSLFWKQVEAIEKIKPRYFLVENNFRIPKADKDMITKALGVFPILLDSQDFSAQSRKRLYWTNIPVDLNKVKEHSAVAPCLQDILEYGVASRDKSKTVRIGGACSGWGNKHEWDMPNSDRVYTTIELERLQTFPDDYTKVEGISDKTRRKVLGNAWTVDVISFIFSFIK